jgi:sulfur transfer protein SufE
MRAACIDEIIGNFTVLDDWDDRYRYLIELGRELLATMVKSRRLLSESRELIARANAVLDGEHGLLHFGHK